jgi:hypothetical protein
VAVDRLLADLHRPYLPLQEVAAMTIRAPDCFTPLTIKPQALAEHLDGLEKDSQPWQPHFGFRAIELDPSLIHRDPALSLVHSAEPIAKIGLLKVGPSTFYSWHTDTHRMACINMLVTHDGHSHTLFGSDLDYTNKQVIELQYQPHTLYLFNNQAEHCVLNLGGPRYLFSLYFHSQKPYHEVRARLFSAGAL